MAKKIKLTRKQIRKPDEFLSWSEEAWDWAAEHVYHVLGVIAGLILLFVIIQSIVYLVKNRTSEPEAMLGDGLAIMRAPLIPENEVPPPGLPHAYQTDTQRAEASVKAFLELEKKYATAPEGQLALLYLAGSYERLADYPKAEEYYRKFLGTAAAKGKDYLKLGATLGLARAQFEQKKLPEALDNFNAVIAADSVFKDAAMVGAARVLYTQDQKAKGDELLAKARAEFPDSYLAQPSGFLSRFWAEEGTMAPPTAPAAPTGGASIGLTMPEAASGTTTIFPASGVTPTASETPPTAPIFGNTAPAVPAPAAGETAPAPAPGATAPKPAAGSTAPSSPPAPAPTPPETPSVPPSQP